MNIPSATAHAVTLIRLFTFIFRFSIGPLLCSAIQPSLYMKDAASYNGAASITAQCHF
jgi:hypothetical protein